MVAADSTADVTAEGAGLKCAHGLLCGVGVPSLRTRLGGGDGCWQGKGARGPLQGLLGGSGDDLAQDSAGIAGN